MLSGFFFHAFEDDGLPVQLRHGREALSNHWSAAALPVVQGTSGVTTSGVALRTAPPETALDGDRLRATSVVELPVSPRPLGHQAENICAMTDT